MTSSKAVLFGLNYLGSEYELRGCANDVHNMAQFLKEDMQFENIDVYTEEQTPSKVNAQGIMTILWQLVQQSHTENLDRVWIHYSGHGIGITDTSGDEKDGMDEAICPTDYLKVGVITDDTIKSLLKKFNPRTKVVCIFDCCHSGTMGDLRYKLTPDVKTVIDNETGRCPSKVVMISGCRDDQESADAYNVSGKGKFTGALTSCLLDCLRFRRPFRNDMSISSLCLEVKDILKRRGFSQIPVVTSSMPHIETLNLF